MQTHGGPLLPPPVRPMRRRMVGASTPRVRVCCSGGKLDRVEADPAAPVHSRLFVPSRTLARPPSRPASSRPELDGDDAFAAGRLDEAIEKYTLALTQKPTLVCYEKRCAAWAHVGRYKQVGAPPPPPPLPLLPPDPAPPPTAAVTSSSCAPEEAAEAAPEQPPRRPLLLTGVPLAREQALADAEYIMARQPGNARAELRVKNIKVRAPRPPPTPRRRRRRPAPPTASGPRIPRRHGLSRPSPRAAPTPPHLRRLTYFGRGSAAELPRLQGQLDARLQELARHAPLRPHAARPPTGANPPDRRALRTPPHTAHACVTRGGARPLAPAGLCSSLHAASPS